MPQKTVWLLHPDRPRLDAWWGVVSENQDDDSLRDAARRLMSEKVFQPGMEIKHAIICQRLVELLVVEGRSPVRRTDILPNDVVVVSDPPVTEDEVCDKRQPYNAWTQCRKGCVLWLVPLVVGMLALYYWRA